MGNLVGSISRREVRKGSTLMDVEKKKFRGFIVIEIDIETKKISFLLGHDSRA